MKNSRISKGWQAGLFLWVWLAAFLPTPVFGGHGVEESLDTLSADRVKLLLDSGDKLVLIDLRPVQEFQKNRLPGARSLPLTEFTKRFNEIPKTGRIVLYCACSINELADKFIFLENQGYRNIFAMPEGYAGWVKRGYPVEAPR
jgi:rhodanese-related sulfurtransferase